MIVTKPRTPFCGLIIPTRMLAYHGNGSSLRRPLTPLSVLTEYRPLSGAVTLVSGVGRFVGFDIFSVEMISFAPNREGCLDPAHMVVFGRFPRRQDDMVAIPFIDRLVAFWAFQGALGQFVRFEEFENFREIGKIGAAEHHLDQSLRWSR